MLQIAVLVIYKITDYDYQAAFQLSFTKKIGRL